MIHAMSSTATSANAPRTIHATGPHPTLAPRRPAATRSPTAASARTIGDRTGPAGRNGESLPGRSAGARAGGGAGHPVPLVVVARLRPVGVPGGEGPVQLGGSPDVRRDQAPGVHREATECGRLVRPVQAEQHHGQVDPGGGQPARRRSDPDDLTGVALRGRVAKPDRKSTRLNSSHEWISYAVFCLKKKDKVLGVFIKFEEKKEKLIAVM